jgi:hypothetical protein
MKTKAAFYFLILCQQLLSLERYRRKKGVEVKIHCRTKGVLRYKVTIYSTKFGILHTFFQVFLEQARGERRDRKDICRGGDLPSCHLSGRIQVLYYWGYAKLPSLWKDTVSLLLGICQAVISLEGYSFLLLGICQVVISLEGYSFFVIGDMPSCHLSVRKQVLYYWGYAKLSSVCQETGTLLLELCQAFIYLAGYRYFFVICFWGSAKLSSLWHNTGALLLGICQAVISLAVLYTGT